MPSARRSAIAIVFAVSVAACSSGRDPVAAAETVQATAPAPVDRIGRLAHPTPYIPPQCYTKTRDDDGRVHNPCFTCHLDATPPNYLTDRDLQLEYAFGAPARTNRWTNLFVDRTAAVAAIPDDEILAYVRRSNYQGPAGDNLVAARVAKLDPRWDADHDGRWSGWTPDVAFRFDDRGFDRRPDGGYTGWRAFAYYPLPGTFWPTNGSFGDVLIRLPEPFRQRVDGGFDRALYEINLAILEALIARRDVAIDPTDETGLGVDLDGDGRLATARRVRFRASPDGGGLGWVGRAGALQAVRQIELATGLFPVGTELAHSVRYIDVDGGRVRMAARMKELRYMVKERWYSYRVLQQEAAREVAEDSFDPDAVRPIIASEERGIGNRSGWRLQAFIEDAGGDLRPQTPEEHGFCIGCHGGIGATDDSVFSFGRKLPSDQRQRGWYHWSQHGLDGVAEPVRADGQGEYAFYLEQNGAGDELRANREVQERFFDGAGRLRPEMRALLARDVAALLLPGPARGLALDKAYRVIVTEQSFARGRDATIEPAAHVHRTLRDGDEIATGVVWSVDGPRRGGGFTYPGTPRARPVAAPLHAPQH